MPSQSVEQTHAQDAVRNGDCRKLLRVIRDYPWIVDQKDRQFHTLIELAVDKDKPEIIELLMVLGCRTINATNPSDKTHVYRATSRGHAHLIELLVRLGFTRLNYTNIRMSALELSIQKKHPHCTTVLRALGARRHASYSELPPLDDEEVLRVRFRVYFQESLFSRMIRANNAMRWRRCKKCTFRLDLDSFL